MHLEKLLPALTGQTSESQPAPLVTDLVRLPWAIAMEAACAFFRSSEAMHRVQQQTTHQMRLRHEAATHKLHAGCTTADLLNIPSELLNFDVARAVQGWQQLAALALQTQLELITSASHLHDCPASNGLRTTLSTCQTALPLVNGFFSSKPSYSICQ